jgi:hypothetical protein
MSSCVAQDQPTTIDTSASRASKDSSASSSTRYWLRNHLHVCATPDGAVFLDLRKDRYFGLCGRDTAALAAVIHDWPTYKGAASQNFDRISDEEARDIAANLAKHGLLTTDTTQGKTARAPAIVSARTMASIRSEDARPIAFTDIANFLYAYTSTVLSLRTHSLEWVVNRVVRRKQHAVPAAGPQLQLQKIGELTFIFRRLRTFFFSARGRCLFHALVLHRFLLRYGLASNVVIGVKTDPWSAHSWVQYEDVVLDSAPDDVHNYTPILVI